MSKQDRQGVRTPSELEQKYNFGAEKAESKHYASMAQRAAQNAAETVSQCVNRNELDQVVSNADLITKGTLKSQDGTTFYLDVSNNILKGSFAELSVAGQTVAQIVLGLFAQSISVSGKFTHSASVFLEPGEEEIDTIKNHISGVSTISESDIPLYDFDNDGSVTELDLEIANNVSQGIFSLSNWSGAVLSDVTVTIDFSKPEKVFSITGTNMWGRMIDSYMGANFVTARNPSIEKRLAEITAELEEIKATLVGG